MSENMRVIDEHISKTAAICEATLSDGSYVYAVRLSDEDGKPFIVQCVDHKAASELCDVYLRCSA